MKLSNKSFAIVGASNNPQKYGYRVVEALKKISASVFPINPKEEKILGLGVFKKVQQVKSPLDIVVFVLPPALTLEVLKEITSIPKYKKLHFWLQPGSFDDAVIAFLKENKLNFTADKCVIIESEKEFN